MDLNKLHVTFLDQWDAQTLCLPRYYTLTHSDMTGDLFLTIGRKYNLEQISGFYTRIMRDEVLASLSDEAGGKPSLDIFCHVSGGFVFGSAKWRYQILQDHMPMVIQALRYGDRWVFETCPEMKIVQIIVHFASNQEKFNRTENWGSIYDY